MRTAVLAMLLYAAAWATGADYFREGNASDRQAATRGGTVLMGGGKDVDAAFQWMCELSGGGDFLVLRARGTDAYNSYIRKQCPGANSVATLIVATREAASEQATLRAVEHAEAVWIAGGDQSNYVKHWKGTPLARALQAKVGRMPVGGTSAGMAVLTEFLYPALLSQGATSAEALANPYAPTVMLDRGFVRIAELEGLIGDTHFVERDRMGRTLAFLCRIHALGWSAAPRAVAVDRAAALLVEPGGAARLVGDGSAYFLEAPGAPQACEPGRRLTYRGVRAYRITNGGTFDLRAWQGSGGLAYTLSVEDGALSSTQPAGAVY